jgi:diguanylate cyclase (GGDEF)-like protein
LHLAAAPMRSSRTSPDPDSLRAADAQAPSAQREAADGLALYRLLASFPALASYRAKLSAIVIAGTLVPAFVLLLVLVLGAGRWSLVAVLGIVVVLFGAAVAAMLWAIGRLLAPLDLAAKAIDDIALDHAPARIELPGNDAVAQVLRGVQALVGRIASQADAARKQAESDAVTGLANRRTGRDRAQALVDRECRRGRAVRAVLADVAGFRAFNARHGAGHGDALLRAIGRRLLRLAGDGGIAVRWDGDAFLLVEAAAPDAFADANELLGRPIVIKGSEEPVVLDLGIATTAEWMPIDALFVQAESALSAARAQRGRGGEAARR